MTTKLSRKALALLNKTLNGASGIETDEGTQKLWNELEKAGYVSRMKFGGLLGHKFSYNITTKGREALNTP